MADNTQKFVMTLAEASPSGTLIKVGISAFKLLTGASDPMDRWMRGVEAALAEQARYLNRLNDRLNEANARLATIENLELVRELDRLTGEFLKELARVGQGYEDQRTLDAIATNIGIELDKFIDRADLWQVTSIEITDHYRALEDVAYRTETDAVRHFSVYLPLPVYTAGVAALMLALEAATRSNTSAIRSADRRRLERHIAFLATRPDWRRDDPRSLSERVKASLAGELVGFTRYVQDEECRWGVKLQNAMSRATTYSYFASSHPGAAPNALCSLPEPQARWWIDAAIESFEQQNGIALIDEIVSAMRHFVTYADASGPPSWRFAQTASRLNEILYTVDQDGSLLWSRVNPDRAARDSTPWLGPLRVGDGWNAFRAVIPAGGWSLYAVNEGGSVLQYDHLGFNDGEYRWSDPRPVRAAWNDARRIVGGGDGVVYVVDDAGRLFWNRHDGLALGGGAETWRERLIGSDWTQFSTVFSGGQGVLYGVRPNGQVLWYRHMDAADGANLWQGHTVLNVEPVGCIDGFAVDGGVFFLRTDRGELLRYEHPGWLTGEANVDRPQVAASGLAGVRTVFGMLARSARGPH